MPPNKKKIAALKGKRQVGVISSAERGETTTVVMSMSANGHYLPPFVIFPRARMNDSLKHGAPPGTMFVCNPSGYMTIDVFKTWFDHFLDHAHPSEADPVLLLVDGHSSHTKNLAVIEKARKYHVTILVLPPHCTNKMQPLDVSFMAPFKAHYSSAAEAYLRSKPGHIISQYDIMRLMGIAFGKAATIPVAANGFKKCGLWPCDRSVFEENSFAPSLVTDQPLADMKPDPVQCKKENVDPAETSAAMKEHVYDNQQSTKTSFVISPDKILPLPKMTTTRVTKRKLRGTKAAEITSDSYHQNLTVVQAAKDILSIKKGRKTTQRLSKRQKLNGNFEDSLCDRCGLCFSDSMDGKGWKTCITCNNRIHFICYKDSDLVCLFCTP